MGWLTEEREQERETMNTNILCDCTPNLYIRHYSVVGHLLVIIIIVIVISLNPSHSGASFSN